MNYRGVESESKVFAWEFAAKQMSDRKCPALIMMFGMAYGAISQHT